MYRGYNAATMARLAPAQCPACKVSVRVDPDVEYHVCARCRTRAFVRSPARVVPPEVQREGLPVIVLSGGYTWTLALVLAFAGLGCGLVAFSLLRNANPERWVTETSNAMRENVGAVATLLESQAPTPEAVLSAPATADTAVGPIAASPVAASPVAASSVAAAANAAAHAANSPSLDVVSEEALAPAATDVAPSKKRTAEDSKAKTSAKSVTGKVTTGQITVSGRLPSDTIRKVVGGANGRFRMCYERGLQSDGKLGGRVSVRFVIGRDGSVSNVSNGGSDLADSGVVSCVVRAFYGLKFTPPEAGIVTVAYPLRFSPT